MLNEGLFSPSPSALYSSTLSLITQFLRMELPQPNLAIAEQYAREYASLEIRLPRGQGSTSLCHQLADDALIILFGNDECEHFRSTHAEKYKITPVCFSIFEIASLIKHLDLVQPDLNSISDFSSLLKNTNLIVFDVFSKYSDNMAVKRLLQNCGFTHRFIMFR